MKTTCSDAAVGRLGIAVDMGRWKKTWRARVVRGDGRVDNFWHARMEHIPTLCLRQAAVPPTRKIIYVSSTSLYDIFPVENVFAVKPLLYGQRKL